MKIAVCDDDRSTREHIASLIREQEPDAEVVTFEAGEEIDLYKSYTMQQLLDKLDVLECFEDENRKLRIGELAAKLKRQ